jgi:hypothetical protein
VLTSYEKGLKIVIRFLRVACIIQAATHQREEKCEEAREQNPNRFRLVGAIIHENCLAAKLMQAQEVELRFAKKGLL